MKRRGLLLALLLAAGTAVAQIDADSQDAQETRDRAGTTQPPEPRIADVRLGIGDRRILLSFKLQGAFDESMEKRLESGLPTSFTYQLELVRSRKRWFDKAVATSTLRVGAMYNAVARHYLINFEHDGDLIESRVVKDAEELRRAMTEHQDFGAFSTEGLDPEQRLRARVRAELRTRTVFFFIPSTVHTDWAETRKFRLAEEL